MTATVVPIKAKGFDITPAPRLIEALVRKGWFVKGALAELVDNPFGPDHGQATTVWIIWSPKYRILSVLDDGLGVDPIGLIFQLGSKGDYIDPDGIGRNGIGATEATVWLSQEVEVYSLRGDQMMHDSVNWVDVAKSAAYPHVSDEWVKVAAKDIPDEFTRNGVKRGTLIRMRLREDPNKRIIMSASQIAELARTYGPGLRDGKKIIWQEINAKGVITPTSLTDPVIRPNKPGQGMVDLEKEKTMVRACGVALPVKGRIYYNTSTAPKDCRIDLCYGYRVINDNPITNWYIDPKGKRRQSKHISGRVMLTGTWKDHLTPNKDGVTNPELERALHAAVYEKIEGLLQASDDLAIDIKLQGLSLDLQRSINRAEFSPVDPDTYKKPRVGNPRPVKPPEPEPVEPPEPPVLGPVDPDAVPPPPPPTQPPNAKRKDGGNKTTSVAITKNSASEMTPEGSLAYAVAEANRIEVWVNKEHVYIEDALDRNKRLLHYACVSEIAAAISRHSHPEIFFRDEAFKKSLNEKNPNTVRLMITSFLMQGVIDQVEEPTP